MPVSYTHLDVYKRQPFDYQHNCLLYLPTDPIPLDAADYYDRLAAQIRQLAAASHGHALVLFLSLIHI